ncbi:MAG: hypothetical protein ACLRPT_03110 [Akkermansia muciniphila]
MNQLIVTPAMTRPAPCASRGAACSPARNPAVNSGKVAYISNPANMAVLTADELAVSTEPPILNPYRG